MSLRCLIWCAVSTPRQADDTHFSLPKQEEDARAVCEKEGWRVVDVIRIPGHSRYYDTIAEAATDMREAGIDALDKFMQHITRRDFDVLVVRDTDRFGRTPSMLNEVMQKTYRAGAKVNTLAGGMIERHESLVRATFGGMMSATDIERLVQYRHNGMLKRTSRGLPVARPPLSHVVVRNDSGKPLRLVPNEAVRHVIEEAVRLFLEGVGWRGLGDEVFKRTGYITPNGVPISQTGWRALFLNPIFWGNSAYGRKLGTKQQAMGLWAFDASIEPPEGVSMFYETHEPALSDDLGERLKSELRRRADSVRGRSRPYKSTIFAGLLVCDVCGRRLAFHTQRWNKKVYAEYYICPARGKNDTCTNNVYTRVERFKAQLEPRLQRLIDGETLESVLSLPVDDTAQRIANLDAGIEQAREQARGLIQLQMRNVGLADLYQEQIEAVQQQLERLTASRDELLKTSPSVTDEQQHALSRLRLLESASDLWKLPDVEINQMLHAVFGRRKLAVLRGEIVGLVVV